MNFMIFPGGLIPQKEIMDVDYIDISDEVGIDNSDEENINTEDNGNS